MPDEKLVEIARIFDAARIPYAFGGAIALVYWGEPRGTIDIDVNVFLPAEQAPRVFATLNAAGIATTEGMAAEAVERGQLRVAWGGTFIDLFFSYDPFHDSCQARAVRVDFYGHPVPVLSAEDIALFKTLFDRPKDWPDIEQLLAVQGHDFDLAYTLQWLGQMLPVDDSARLRLESLLRRYSGHDSRQGA